MFHFVFAALNRSFPRTAFGLGAGAILTLATSGAAVLAGLRGQLPVCTRHASSANSVLRLSSPEPEPTPSQPPIAKKSLLGVPDGVEITRDVVYATVNGKALLLDVYLPASNLTHDPLRDRSPAKEPEETKDDKNPKHGKDGTSKPPASVPASETGQRRDSSPASEAPQSGAQTTHTPLPVIIWVHGGGWEMGSKSASPAAQLVPFGYAAVSISYRFSQIAPYPAQIHDCKSAVRWVRANATKYNFDPDRIGVWGASAGGHLVALLGTSAGEKELEGDVGDNLDQSSRVQAVCDWFGPTDIIKLCRMASGESAAEAAQPRSDLVVPSLHKPQPAPASTSPALSVADGSIKSAKKLPKLSTPRPLKKLLGGVVQDKLDVAVLANPVTFVDQSDAPVLIVHGDRDSLVPLDQSELLKAALEQAGVKVTLHVVKGGGHGFWNDDLLELVRKFFDETLKPKEPTKVSAPSELPKTEPN